MRLFLNYVVGLCLVGRWQSANHSSASLPTVKPESEGSVAGVDGFCAETERCWFYLILPGTLSIIASHRSNPSRWWATMDLRGGDSWKSNLQLKAIARKRQWKANFLSSDRRKRWKERNDGVGSTVTHLPFGSNTLWRSTACDNVTQATLCDTLGNTVWHPVTQDTRVQAHCAPPPALLHAVLKTRHTHT